MLYNKVPSSFYYHSIVSNTAFLLDKPTINAAFLLEKPGCFDWIMDRVAVFFFFQKAIVTLSLWLDFGKILSLRYCYVISNKPLTAMVPTALWSAVKKNGALRSRITDALKERKRSRCFVRTLLIKDLSMGPHLVL